MTLFFGISHNIKIALGLFCVRKSFSKFYITRQCGVYNHLWHNFSVYLTIHVFLFISISKFQLRLSDAYFWGKTSPISPLTLPLIVCLKCFWRVTLSFHVAISFLTTIFKGSTKISDKSEPGDAYSDDAYKKTCIKIALGLLYLRKSFSKFYITRQCGVYNHLWHYFSVHLTI